MVIFLSTLLIVLFATAIFIFFIQKRRESRETEAVSRVAPPAVGLFDEQNNLAILEEERAKRRVAEDTLRSRANAGDLHVLREVAGDGRRQLDELYADLLDRLITSAASQQELFRLVSHVARDEQLKVTPSLASTFLEKWKENPERLTVAEVLHVSALSNDPLLYHRACEAAVEYLGSGRLPYVKAVDLMTLIEGEYWILSSNARGSGQGFILKRSINGFRRQLMARSRR